MVIYQVTIKTLDRYSGGTHFYTLGYYKNLDRAKQEAQIEIEKNYKAFGSCENPRIDFAGRKTYLIENRAIYEEIVVKE